MKADLALTVDAVQAHHSRSGSSLVTDQALPTKGGKNILEMKAVVKLP